MLGAPTVLAKRGDRMRKSSGFLNHRYSPNLLGKQFKLPTAFSYDYPSRTISDVPNVTGQMHKNSVRICHNGGYAAQAEGARDFAAAF
jgi:hypothetical protein